MIGSSNSFGSTVFATPERRDPNLSAQRSSGARGKRSSLTGGSGVWTVAGSGNSVTEPGSTQRRRASESLPPPCLPSSSGMLWKAAKLGGLSGGRNTLYDDVRYGVVSLVGIAASDLDYGTNPSFELSDGTSSKPVTVDLSNVRTEDERWKNKRYDEIVKAKGIVRVVGVPSYDPQADKITINPLHLDRASADEYAYYHVLETVHTYLTTTGKLEGILEPTGSDGKSFAVDSQQAYSSFSTDPSTPFKAETSSAPVPQRIELPPCFYEVKDAVEREVVHCIMTKRQGEMGCSAKVVEDLVGRDGTVGTEQIETAIRSLENAGHIFPSIDGHFDVLFDGPDE